MAVEIRNTANIQLIFFHGGIRQLGEAMGLALNQFVHAERWAASGDACSRKLLGAGS